MKHTKSDLKQMQALPLSTKIQMSFERIREWYEEWVKYTVCDTNTRAVVKEITKRKMQSYDCEKELNLLENEYIQAAEDGQVFVSFSGGKDSTVLSDLCAKVCEMYGWKLYLVFVNTGLEYPEIQSFVKQHAQWLRDTYHIEVELEILRPDMRFDNVIRKHGYPIIGKQVSNSVRLAKQNIVDGKYSIRLWELGICPEEGQAMGLSLPPDDLIERYRKTIEGSKFAKPQYKPLLGVDFNISEKCCDVMKKAPAHKYEKATGRTPLLATMASESLMRESAWLKSGCNAFDSDRPRSTPMAFWTEQDIYQYIKTNNLPIASVYGEVVYKKNPDQVRFDCCGGEELCTTGCDRTGCIFCAFGAHLEKEPSRFQRLEETHPKQYAYCIGGGEYNEEGVWQPSKEGLGMGHVFDEMNKIYGEGFIKY